MSDEELASQRPWTLALLTATLVSSYADRQVLSSLFEPIKRDLSLSDAQLGVLRHGGRGLCAAVALPCRCCGASPFLTPLCSGLAVAMFGALFGVHIARAADAAPLRRTVLAACLVAWSAATVSGGLASGFWSLLFSRVCVGVGEAGAIPISLAILADAYPQSARSVAMSVYYVGIPGGALPFRVAAALRAAAFGQRSESVVRK